MPKKPTKAVKGKQGTFKQAGGFAGKGGSKGNGARVTEGVPLFKYLAKSGTRSYPDPSGLTVMTNGLPPSMYYTNTSVQNWLMSENTECCANIAQGWSTIAAMMESGVEALQVLGSLDLEDADLQRTGLPALLKALNLPFLLENTRKVNVKAGPGPSKKEYQAAFKSMLKPFSKKADVEERFVSYASLVDFGSRLTTLGYAAMECTAHATDLPACAAKLAKRKQQPKLVRAWAADAKKVDLLAKALAELNVPQQMMNRVPERSNLPLPVVRIKTTENSDDSSTEADDENEESEEEEDGEDDEGEESESENSDDSPDQKRQRERRRREKEKAIQSKKQAEARKSKKKDKSDKKNKKEVETPTRKGKKKRRKQEDNVSEASPQKKKKRSKKGSSEASSPVKKKVKKGTKENASDSSPKRKKKVSKKSSSEASSPAPVKRQRREDKTRDESEVELKNAVGAASTPALIAGEDSDGIPDTILATWSIEDLNAFLEKAQHEITEANLAELDAAMFKELIDSMPTELRVACDLPEHSDDYAVLQKNAREAAEKIQRAVASVQSYWRSQK